MAIIPRIKIAFTKTARPRYDLSLGDGGVAVLIVPDGAEFASTGFEFNGAGCAVAGRDESRLAFDGDVLLVSGSKTRTTPHFGHFVERPRNRSSTLNLAVQDSQRQMTSAFIERSAGEKETCKPCEDGG